MTIDWFPELRAKLAPRRAEDARAEEPHDPVLLKSAWASQHRMIDAGPLSAEWAAIHAWMDNGPVPSPVAIGVTMRVFDWDYSRRFLPGIACAAHGAAGAVEAVVAANTHVVRDLPRGGKALLREAPGWTMGALELRRILLRTTDRAPAIAAAERAMTGDAPLPLQLALAHAFFDRPDWAERAARSVVADPRDKIDVSLLYACLATLELVGPVLRKRVSQACLLDLVETFGEPLLDVLLSLYEAKMFDHAEVAEALLPYDDPRAARRFAEELHKKRSQAHAIAFFMKRPSLAEQVLAPMAAGRSRNAGLAREVLASAVRARDNAGAVEASPDALPKPLVDPPWTRGKRAPKIHHALRYDTLTRPRLTSGALLPMPAFQNLIGILATSSADRAHPELADAIDDLDPRDLAELAWDLARTWERLRARKRDRWMIDSLAHLADDEVTRRTTPALAHARIHHVLACIGTDAAAMELFTAVARLQAQGKSTWSADEALAAAAKKRRISQEELEDRVVPTLGLDAKGGIDLDYGARTLRVVFDSRLEPCVLSPKGAPLKGLPAKGKNDDPDKVADAKRAFAELHEDVSALAARRIKALEHAMATQRTWSVPIWNEVWRDHVLMVHLARGVVWESKGVAFRLAEDGTLAGEDDAPIALAGDAPIGVVEPRRMGNEKVARWAEILGDYEIIQPFEQLVLG